MFLLDGESVEALYLEIFNVVKAFCEAVSAMTSFHNDDEFLYTEAY